MVVVGLLLWLYGLLLNIDLGRYFMMVFIMIV